MGISGIGAAEYQMAGYRAGRNGETGTKNFMETVAEKSAQDKVTEYGEKAFDLVGAKAPQSVKNAWMETVEEVGVNGLGMTSNGSTHITQLHIQQVIANYWGLDCKNILGSSVQSAMQAAQKALYDFDHPLEPEKVRSMEEQRARTKEREFYTVFLDKLKNLAGQNQRNEAVNISGGISFTEHVATKAAIQSYVLERSFKDMWQTRFPGAYYHTMDACQISQGIWERLDFPHDEFFRNKVNKSILDWKPTGAEPKMADVSVQSRVGASLGKKSIVVPPALEEKMKNDPALAKQVMGKIETFIATKEAAKRPGRICSYILVLDEEGEIAHTCISSGGGISGPTEAAQRQFEAEQEAKRKRRAEYMEIVEESALKRKRMEQEAVIW